MAAKGEFEIGYFGAPQNPSVCGGVNYAAPYTSLPATDLAPDSENTQSINSFLCSSPWIADTPFTNPFRAGEYILGIFQVNGTVGVAFTVSGATEMSLTLVVTNLAVYVTTAWSLQSTTLGNAILNVVHTWSGTELDFGYLWPGQCVSFCQVNTTVYMVGLFFNGIYLWDPSLGFRMATNSVSGRFIAELAGRLVVAECYSPSGATMNGEAIGPFIAWSGVGIFGQAWDNNPAHDVWNAANIAYFNGNIGGFNLLGDVPDHITGMALLGQSIIITRNNGITQQDPNSNYSNSGLQPYNWYHMWSSAEGVGADVGSVAQYGQTLTFKSSDNVYSLSLSGGLNAIGPKIFPKIDSDIRAINNSPGVWAQAHDPANPAQGVGFYRSAYWLFAAMYPLDGQLHYVLVLSTFTTDALGQPTSQFHSCHAYDYNVAENAWHFWDFGTYWQQNGTQGASFIGMSCPPVMLTSTFLPTAQPTFTLRTISNPRFFLFGAITSFGVPLLTGDPNITGRILQLVPVDYNFEDNPYSQDGYIWVLYVPFALPLTAITFRGETLQLGHKLSTRRLRVLANNAPVPSVHPVTTQQLAAGGFIGEESIVGSTPTIMQGNFTHTGKGAIKTYYFDMVLSDYSIQPFFTSVFDRAKPWATMCMFRIAAASLIGIDTTSTTQ